MECRIFYSWQADLPNPTNRGFILSALEMAVKSIRNDESIKIEPVIDRDTSGIPGAPDIADTILSKIEKSQIFVADISIINSNDLSRKTPNPNVLVELGYAMRTLGPECIIMVMNTTYGKPELLPFDLRMRRVATYEMFNDGKDRSTERKKLASNLEQGIRIILSRIEQQEKDAVSILSVAEQAITAVTNSHKNQSYLIREYIKDLVKSLLEIAPLFPGIQDTDNPDDVLVQAIANSENFITDFAHLAEMIAVINSEEAAVSLVKSFSHILDRYEYTPPGFSGRYKETQHEFFKFVGDELFIILISFLIRENRWELISSVLDEGIFIQRTSSGRPDVVSFDYISQYIKLFDYRKQRLKLNRISIHADLLNERYSGEKLGAICPISQFISADFFLFLRENARWNPWSALYLFKYFPQFLVEAKRSKYAEKLLRPLGVKDIAELRKLIYEKNRELHSSYRSGFWDSSLDSFDVSAIGSI